MIADPKPFFDVIRNYLICGGLIVLPEALSLTGLTDPCHPPPFYDPYLTFITTSLGALLVVWNTIFGAKLLLGVNGGRRLVPGVVLLILAPTILNLGFLQVDMGIRSSYKPGELRGQCTLITLLRELRDTQQQLDTISDHYARLSSIEPKIDEIRNASRTNTQDGTRVRYQVESNFENLDKEFSQLRRLIIECSDAMQHGLSCRNFDR